MQNPNYVYYVAEIENEIIGFISFHAQKLLHHCGVVGEIQELYVTQNFRNQQIGRFLVNKVKDYATTHNLKSIEVASNKTRTENVCIYKYLAFKLSHNKFTINTTPDL